VTDSRTSFDLQFEWGPNGLARLGPGAAGVVIVDVLRFTTAVSVAVDRGAAVLPYPWADDGAQTYAAQHNALLAGAGRDGSGGARWSLSPVDLARLRPETRLVLPSPNGSALAYGARDHAPHAAVLAGCLRNASAVAHEWRRRCPAVPWWSSAPASAGAPPPTRPATG
jgi:2-phosphosulfolactate phosphatase